VPQRHDTQMIGADIMQPLGNMVPLQPCRSYPNVNRNEGASKQRLRAVASALPLDAASDVSCPENGETAYFWKQ